MNEKISNRKNVTRKFIRHFIFIFVGLWLCLFFAANSFVNAQSINQNYPTPIVSNEISGKIAARDIGDSRLTAYFYTFDGTQGDVFINVVTNNFNGDIDVFTADNLKPLTKITIYADDTDSETGRVVYLRQPVRLILRIEGRSPNDDAATFRVKFAGSFAASQAVADNSEPKTPAVKSNEETGIRVNSVGTIIEVKPKPAPTPKAIAVEKPAEQTLTTAQIGKRKKDKIRDKNKIENEPDKASSDAPPKAVAETIISETNKVKPAEIETKNPTIITIDKNPSPTEEKPSSELESKTAEIKSSETSPANVATDNAAEKNNDKTNIEIKKDSTESVKPETEVKSEEEKPEKETIIAKKESAKRKKTNAPQPVPASALENIRLVILFKDGTKIERPMSEILKFGVDKGILTVISKDGAIGRYSILDVEKTTIQ